MERLLESLLQLPAGLAGIAAHAIVILAAIVLGGLATIGVRHGLVRLATRLAKRTKTQWDDVLLRSGVVGRLAPLVPVIGIYLFSSAFGSAQGWIETLLLISMMGIVVRVIDALFDAGLEIYEGSAVSRGRSLRGVVKFGRVGVALLGAVFVASTLFERVPPLVGAEVEALRQADRADDVDDIAALVERARESLERVRDSDARLSAESERFLQELRERGPALVDAAAERLAAHEGGAESLRELCRLVSEPGPGPAPAPASARDREELAALEASCQKLDAALERSAKD